MEQTRAARKAGPNRAAFGHAAKHLHAQQHRSYQRSRGPCGLPVPPLQADSFGLSYSGFHFVPQLASRAAGAPPARGTRGAVGGAGHIATTIRHKQGGFMNEVSYFFLSFFG